MQLLLVKTTLSNDGVKTLFQCRKNNLVTILLFLSKKVSINSWVGKRTLHEKHCILSSARPSIVNEENALIATVSV